MPASLVIANPSSASGATGKAWPRLASELRSHFGPFQVSFTNQRGDAITLAAEAARKGTPLIIACGGDGTISEVANGILDSQNDSMLGILPSGTGGDFRRTLGIPASPRDAARIIKDGRTRLIDVGRINYVARDGQQRSRYFLGVASFGMSAEIVERVKQDNFEWLSRTTPKWFSGRVSFGFSMLQTAMQSRATRVIVQLDDEHERQLTVANLCVANARYFGGGMKIAPKAKLNDGKFDVVSIGDLGTLRLITNAPRVYAGAHLSLDKIGHTTARKILARPGEKDAEIFLEVDGELPGRLPATFQIVPAALRVRCP